MDDTGEFQGSLWSQPSRIRAMACPSLQKIPQSCGDPCWACQTHVKDILERLNSKVGPMPYSWAFEGLSLLSWLFCLYHPAPGRRLRPPNLLGQVRLKNFPPKHPGDSGSSLGAKRVHQASAAM